MKKNELTISLNLTTVKLLHQAIKDRANVTGLKREIDSITSQPSPDIKLLRKKQTDFANAIAFRTDNEGLINEIEMFLKSQKQTSNNN